MSLRWNNEVEQCMSLSITKYLPVREVVKGIVSEHPPSLVGHITGNVMTNVILMIFGYVRTNALEGWTCKMT